jgi:hypothetical protein
MKNNNQTTESNGSWSFTQEMRQTFVDWVKKLPFIGRNFSVNPEREGPEEQPVDQASTRHSDDAASAGRSRDKNG